MLREQRIGTCNIQHAAQRVPHLGICLHSKRKPCEEDGIVQVMPLVLLSRCTRACYHDSAPGFVGEVEAFTDLASANSKKHGPVAGRICRPNRTSLARH
jgi:hypothetical protein